MVCDCLLALCLPLLLWLLYTSYTRLQVKIEDKGGLPNPGRLSEVIRVRPEHRQDYHDCFSLRCHKLCCILVDLPHNDTDALCLFCPPASV